MSAARVVTLSVIVSALFAAAPLAGAAAAAETPRIAPRVTAGGLDVSGLTEREATKKIEDVLGRKMRAPVVVRVGRESFKLRADEGGFVLDAPRMARGALKIAAPTTAVTGAVSAEDRDVGLSIKHSRSAVKRFVGQVESGVHITPRNASVSLGITKMTLHRSRGGRTIDTAKTAWLVDRALGSLDAKRVLRVRTSWVAPATSANALRRSYPTVVTIDRGTFTLRLFKKLSLSKKYGVAVGMAGLSTPAGRYSIQDKQVDPAWHVPNSAWAGSLAGSVIPGGAPDNPLKARWMGLVDGVGIHGTAEDWSIGSRASHGCIRMHVSDVKDLYSRVSVGTPVIIR
jgi:lipoprotein-anchoring transpeptidase ErfK/SrfK